MGKKLLFVLSVLITSAVVLGGCGASDSTDAPATTVSEAPGAAAVAAPETTTSGPTPTEAPAPTSTTEAPEPDATEATCDWDSSRLPSDEPGDVPTSEGTDIAQVIFGSWQHTHIDAGAGFEPVKPTTDIRYVLSSDRFLYCQDVEGATDQSENSAPLKLDGTEIILPSPATGYAVTAWDDNTMVWLNHRDDSLYLLKRR